MRGGMWGSRRGRCGCLAWGILLVVFNLCIIVVCALLLALVFAVVLVPAMLLLYAGFLCHSRSAQCLVFVDFFNLISIVPVPVVGVQALMLVPFATNTCIISH
uniref:Uncharacterized protein n=1 Tax=Neogobius melanostomus TaxID=47308 RepID=A0A8C6SEY3_9GOBI